MASRPEQFLYPTPIDPPVNHPAQAICRALMRSPRVLPTYHLIPFIALTLNYDQGELATADKLGDRLRQELAGEFNLSTVIFGIQEIVLSARFEVIESENPESQYVRPGQITIISLHKSKGLDWDVVFMPFLDDRICPGKSFIPDSSKFLGEYNLAEVARLQIRALIHHQEIPDANSAWQQSQLLKQQEEFRLLYMGMTRPKRLLHISAAEVAPFTWHNLDSQSSFKPCPAIAALARQFPEAVIPI